MPYKLLKMKKTNEIRKEHKKMANNRLALNMVLSKE